MSQPGKRNYRPRQNNNQINKNVQSEVKQTEEIVEQIPVENIEPEIEETITKPEPEVKEEKKTFTTGPQIIMGNLEQTKEEFIQEVIKNQPEENKVPEKVEKPKKEQTKVKETIKKQKETKTPKKENKKPHYVFGRDNETGKINVSTNKGDKKMEEPKIFVNLDKQEVISNLIVENTRSIYKLEIEIEVSEKLREKELDPKKIEVIENRIEMFRKNIKDLEERKLILGDMLQ